MAKKNSFGQDMDLIKEVVRPIYHKMLDSFANNIHDLKKAETSDWCDFDSFCEEVAFELRLAESRNSNQEIKYERISSILRAM